MKTTTKVTAITTPSRATATLLDAARALADWMLAAPAGTATVDHMLYDERRVLSAALREMTIARRAEMGGQ